MPEVTLNLTQDQAWLVLNILNQECLHRLNPEVSYQDKLKYDQILGITESLLDMIKVK